MMLKIKNNKLFFKYVFAFLIILLFQINHIYLYASNENIAPEISTGINTQKSVTAKDFIVVSANKFASEAGYQIIEKGGNAVDAAIAVQMVLNIVEPQSSGIGGGGFLLYYDSEKKRVISFDGRETAPSKATEKLFLDENNEPMSFMEAIKGGRSVGTPGLIRMLQIAHGKYGKLKWKELFIPAIKLAKNGFPLSPRLHKMLSEIEHQKSDDEMQKLYYGKNGNPLDIGTIIKNNKLAKVFTEIADNPDNFYEGEIAKDIVRTVNNNKFSKGSLSLEDLKNYKAYEKSSICRLYKDNKICGMTTPSSGGITILQIMGILNNFKINDLQFPSVKAISVISEASRLAFADRNKYIADSLFTSVPTDRMLDPSYLEKRADLIRENLIKDDSIIPSVEAGEISTDYNLYSMLDDFERPSTTHISIIDKKGNAVSMTSSIEYAFGSGTMVNGFLLNNQLSDFSFVPEKDNMKIANRVEANKRPRSSMSPTIILDKNDNLKMVVGSPGGSRIIGYVMQTIIAVLDWKYDIQKAINMPHIISKSRNIVELEKGYDLDKYADELNKLGYKTVVRDLNSGLHAIYVNENGTLTGAADPRREGYAIGK